jgi:hypothetical protein
MILCVAPVAYRRPTSALESPKGQLLWSVKLSVVFFRSDRHETGCVERIGGRQPARFFRVLTEP